MTYVHQDRYQYADNFKRCVDELTHLHSRHIEPTLHIKETARHLEQAYQTELQLVSQAKQAYMRKYEAMLNLVITDPKFYKAQSDLKEAEAYYRSRITHLEDIRCQLQFTREKAKSLFQTFETETFRLIQDSFFLYGNSVQVTGNKFRNASQKFESVVQNIPAFQLDPHHFEIVWKPMDPVYFEDFSTGLDLQDLLFGVPLNYSIRLIPDIIPPFLKKSCHEIEVRGLDLEGIYRIASKNTDKMYWKTKIETDMSKIDFGAIDVHILAGLIKEYFRELPEPLFPMVCSDRVEYASIPDTNQRLHTLKLKVATLPRNNLTVLKFLLEHLQKVASCSNVNKMDVFNLALLFGAVLFEKESNTLPQEDSQPVSTFGSWFSAPKPKRTQQSELSLYEHMKQELVLEDLISHFAYFFGEKRPAPSPRVRPTTLASTLSRTTTSLLLAPQSNTYVNDYNPIIQTNLGIPEKSTMTPNPVTTAPILLLPEPVPIAHTSFPPVSVPLPVLPTTIVIPRLAMANTGGANATPEITITTQLDDQVTNIVENTPIKLSDLANGISEILASPDTTENTIPGAHAREEEDLPKVVPKTEEPSVLPNEEPKVKSESILEQDLDVFKLAPNVVVVEPIRLPKLNPKAEESIPTSEESIMKPESIPEEVDLAPNDVVPEPKTEEISALAEEEPNGKPVSILEPSVVGEPKEDESEKELKTADTPVVSSIEHKPTKKLIAPSKLRKMKQQTQKGASSN